MGAGISVHLSVDQALYPMGPVAARLRLRGDPVSGAEVAILLAMSMAEQLPLADVKNRLSEVVERVEREHGRVVITKHGRPAAVVLSVEDLESLEETLEILSDPAVLADIREAELERSRGVTKKLSKDEALARLRKQ